MKHRFGGDAIRDGMPAIYNPRRLVELPMPALIIDMEQNGGEADVAQMPPLQNDVAEIVAPNNEDVLFPIEPQVEAQLPHQNNIALALVHNAAALRNDDNVENLVDDAANEPEAEPSIEQQDVFVDDIVLMDIEIDVIVIESDDENAEPAESKVDVLPRVKVESSDLAVFEVILNGQINKANATQEDHTAPNPQHQPAALLPEAFIGQPGPSSSMAAATATEPQDEVVGAQDIVGSSDSKEVFFNKTPPKPRQAKLERDDFSGKIPYIENVCVCVY